MSVNRSQMMVKRGAGTGGAHAIGFDIFKTRRLIPFAIQLVATLPRSCATDGRSRPSTFCVDFPDVDSV